MREGQLLGRAGRTREACALSLAMGVPVRTSQRRSVPCRSRQSHESACNWRGLSGGVGSSAQKKRVAERERSECASVREPSRHSCSVGGSSAVRMTKSASKETHATSRGLSLSRHC